jgi:hypothetical protein
MFNRDQALHLLLPRTLRNPAFQDPVNAIGMSRLDVLDRWGVISGEMRFQATLLSSNIWSMGLLSFGEQPLVN